MNPKKILVIDDEPDATLFVTHVIESMGEYIALSASNGEEGMRIARAESPDLILLDIIMPVKDGYTTFCELKRDAQTAKIPVIMLSGLSEMGDLVRARALPIEDSPELFIDKPIQPDKLKQLITGVFKKREAS